MLGREVRVTSSQYVQEAGGSVHSMRLVNELRHRAVEGMERHLAADLGEGTGTEHLTASALAGGAALVDTGSATPLLGQVHKLEKWHSQRLEWLLRL